MSAPTVSRDELIAMVASAHQNATYADSSLAGKTLAAESKLPKVIAENLGAGFGQWEFFPEATEIVDFAHAYVPPANAEELWALARSWAADDAAGRKTLLALVGREILRHELRRIEVPELRAFVDEKRASKALAMRASLGLAVPEAAPAKPATAARKAKAARGDRPPTPEPTPPGSAPGSTPGTTRSEAGAAPVAKPGIPGRMPKPAFVRPPPAAPPPAARRFRHPKFGEGVLVSESGSGDDAKLTIKFDGGPKTLLARFVTEVT